MNEAQKRVSKILESTVRGNRICYVFFEPAGTPPEKLSERIIGRDEYNRLVNRYATELVRQHITKDFMDARRGMDAATLNKEITNFLEENGSYQESNDPTMYPQFENEYYDALRGGNSISSAPQKKSHLRRNVAIVAGGLALATLATAGGLALNRAFKAKDAEIPTPQLDAQTLSAQEGAVDLSVFDTMTPEELFALFENDQDSVQLATYQTAWEWCLSHNEISADWMKDADGSTYGFTSREVMNFMIYYNGYSAEEIRAIYGDQEISIDAITGSETNIEGTSRSFITKLRVLAGEQLQQNEKRSAGIDSLFRDEKEALKAAEFETVWMTGDKDKIANWIKSYMYDSNGISQDSATYSGLTKLINDCYMPLYQIYFHNSSLILNDVDFETLTKEAENLCNVAFQNMEKAQQAQLLEQNDQGQVLVGYDADGNEIQMTIGRSTPKTLKDYADIERASTILDNALKEKNLYPTGNYNYVAVEHYSREIAQKAYDTGVNDIGKYVSIDDDGSATKVTLPPVGNIADLPPELQDDAKEQTDQIKDDLEKENEAQRQYAAGLQAGDSAGLQAALDEYNGNPHNQEADIQAGIAGQSADYARGYREGYAGGYAYGKSQWDQWKQEDEAAKDESTVTPTPPQTPETPETPEQPPVEDNTPDLPGPGDSSGGNSGSTNTPEETPSNPDLGGGSSEIEWDIDPGLIAGDITEGNEQITTETTEEIATPNSVAQTPQAPQTPSTPTAEVPAPANITEQSIENSMNGSAAAQEALLDSIIAAYENAPVVEENTNNMTR